MGGQQGREHDTKTLLSRGTGQDHGLRHCADAPRHGTVYSKYLSRGANFARGIEDAGDVPMDSTAAMRRRAELQRSAAKPDGVTCTVVYVVCMYVCMYIDSPPSLTKHCADVVYLLYMHAW